MKYLQMLCEQAEVSLELKYYVLYLNALEAALLKEAVKKNSGIYALNLLKAFALKILFLLQHSPFLFGESDWQWRLKQSQSALTAAKNTDDLRIALSQADDVISTANVTEAVRNKIGGEAKNHGVLTHEQAQRYESIRQECITRHESLNNLENTVDTTLQDSAPFIQKLPLPSLTRATFQSHLLPFSYTHPLRPYDVKMAQERFSKENIHHQIQCEGNARIVYHALAKELGQKPTVEKIAEDVHKAKSSLQCRSDRLEQKIEDHRKKITQQTQFSIEHRTQVTLAHANRIEHIALTLAIIIHTLQSCCSIHCQPLLNLMAEAQSLQENLNEQKDSQLLQEKLLAMNAHRCNYEKSITSIRVILFTNCRQLQRQQQLNQDLQNQLAQLVIPICSFDDKNSTVAPEDVKNIKAISDKLTIQKGHLAQEQEKINQIKNIFTA